MRRWLLLFAGSALLAAAQAQEGGPPEKGPDAPEPAPVVGPTPEDWTHAYARVAGIAVLRTEVAADVTGGMPAAHALQRRVTTALIRHHLGRAGVDPEAVSEEEIAEALEEARRGMAGSGVSFEEALARSGQTLAQLRANLKVPVAFRKHVRSLLDEAALRELFARKALGLAGELRASHLLVEVGRGRDEVAAKARAAELRARLGQEPTPAAFAELAAEASEEAVAALTGGDLDWISLRAPSEVPRALVRACFEHGRVGLLPREVRSEQGLHLVFVTATRLPESATFERLRPRLQKEAELARATELMEQWVEETPIAYAPDAPRPPGTPGAPPRRE